MEDFDQGFASAMFDEATTGSVISIQELKLLLSCLRSNWNGLLDPLPLAISSKTIGSTVKEHTQLNTAE